MKLNGMNLIELDKNLTDAEREEWRAIYASYTSSSVISGSVAGVDLHEMNIVPKGKRKPTLQTVRCLIVIKYRVKIIIPEHEVFANELDTGYHILHSMCGANISYVITHIEREAGFAIASRRLALEKVRMTNKHRDISAGQTVNAEIISVGRNMCTAHYLGYDSEVPQREASHNYIPDLRDVIHTGDKVRAVVKEFDSEDGKLVLSIKEGTAHPFDGVEIRHPIGSSRMATIVGKYNGGVICTLYDGATDVICSYSAMQYDGDFKTGDKVEIIIRKYNETRKLVYGKILRKIRSR